MALGERAGALLLFAILTSAGGSNLIASLNMRVRCRADAESYEKFSIVFEKPEAVEAIQVGIVAANEGRVKPARPALVDLQEKLGIPS